MRYTSVMRIWLALLVGAMWSVSAWADNVVGVSSVEGRPGQEVRLSVSLRNSDAVSAVQIDLPLPAAVDYVDSSAVIAEGRADGHALTASVAGGRLRLVVYSMDLRDIKGQAGELLSLRLRLKSEPGEFALRPVVKLTDKGGNSRNCQVEEGRIKVLAPRIEIDASAIEFGRVPIRQSHERTFRISNSGTAALQIQNIALGGQAFMLGDYAKNIPAGGSIDVNVMLTPERKGAYKDTLTVVSDAVNGAQALPLSAEAYSVNILKVGETTALCGDTADVRISMKNMEEVSAIQCAMELPEGVSLAPKRAVSLLPTHTAYASQNGRKLTLTLYSPTNALIPEGDRDVISLPLKVAATGGSYVLAPTGVVIGNVGLENVVSSSAEGRLLVRSARIATSETINLGRVAIDAGDTVSISIANEGDAPLVVDKVGGLSSEFALLSSLPLNVEAKTVADLRLVYTPREEGAASTILTIYSNDPLAPAINVQTAAEVYTPNMISVSGEVSGKALNAVAKVALNNLSPITAFQMDITCANGLAIKDSKAVASGRLSAHSLNCRKIGDQTYRVSCYSLTNTAIPKDTGVIYSVELEAETQDNLIGNLLTIDNIKLSTNESRNMASQSAVSFSNNYIADYDSLTNTSSTLDHFLFSGVKDGDMRPLPAVSPDGKVNFLTVALQGGLDTPARRYTAFNMDVALPYGLEMVKEDGQIDVELPQDYSLYATSVSGITHSVAASMLNDSTLRVAATSNSNTSFLKASGDLFEMGVRVSSPYVRPGANAFYFSGLNLTAAEGGHKYKPEDGYQSIEVGEGVVSVDVNIPAASPFVTVLLPFGAALPDSVQAFLCEDIKGTQAVLTPVDSLMAYTPYILYAKGGYSATMKGRLSASAYNQRVNAEGVATAGKLCGAIRPQKVVNGGALVSNAASAEFRKISSARFMTSGQCWIDSELPNVRVEVPKYRLRFVADGAVVKDTLLEYHAAISAPAAPKKTGYTFIGWGDVAERMPADSLTFTAQYSINSYAVTFKVDGKVVLSDTLNYNDTIKVPDVPTREGYTFSGWRNVAKTMPAQNTVYEATFTINRNSLRFVADGAVVMDSLMEYHAAISAPAAPKKTGYTFIGWGSVPEVMPADSLTFTAQYSVNRYSISFVVDGKLVRSDTLNYNDTIKVPTVPAREGYSFNGWRDVAKTVPAQDMVYEATFTINRYRLRFVADGVAVMDSLMEYNAVISAPAAPKKTGYTFTGWGSVPKVMPADSLTFIAQYSLNTYAVIYKVDGEVYRVDSVKYGEKIAIPAAPTKTGYRFVGWGDVPEDMPAEDVELAAVFIALGDVNLDGVINSSDVVAIYNFISEGEASNILQENADINADGVVNSSDAVALYTTIANH